MNTQEKAVSTFPPRISVGDSIREIEKVGIFKKLIRKDSDKALQGIESTLVYYPFWFFTFDVRVHRMFNLPDKKVLVPVAVDAVKEMAGFLEADLSTLVDKNVEIFRIIPHNIGFNRAERIAKEFCKSYISREYHPFSPPDYALTDSQLIHPPYFAVNSTNDSGQIFLVLVNGITGAVERREEILLE
jgi:hypothetical protein